MSKILKVKNVSDHSHYIGHTDRHALVSVIDFAKVSPMRHSLNNYSVYGIFFHDEADIGLSYGCGKYDDQKGTVICVAPSQVSGKEDNGVTGTPDGISLALSSRFAARHAPQKDGKRIFVFQLPGQRSFV